MADSASHKRYITLLQYIVSAIIILVPFHGFITTWAGSNFGNLLLWRAWKEVLLIPGVVIALILLKNDANLRKKLFSYKKLLILMSLFVAWKICMALFGGENISATVLGLAIHTRWVVFFILAAIVGYYKKVTKPQLLKLVLLPALAVILFGILQMTVLPYDFLSSFGYKKGTTIPQFFTIDDQIEHIRIASTLKGPNPLGVYLILPILIVISSWKLLAKSLRNRIAVVWFLVASLVVMYGSHSRGAWIGLIVALGIYALIKFTPKWRNITITAAFIVSLIGIFSIYNFRDTSFVQDVVLHDNPNEGGQVSSNQGHLESLKSGVDNIVDQPILGCGVGCAGPASFHNENGAKISENYFLQTAEESGLVGLLLLLGVFYSTAYILFKKSEDPVAGALLASFIGICTAAMTAHVWADDTIAYLWWGITGLYMYNTNRVKIHDKTKNKVT